MSFLYDAQNCLGSLWFWQNSFVSRVHIPVCCLFAPCNCFCICLYRVLGSWSHPCLCEVVNVVLCSERSKSVILLLLRCGSVRCVGMCVCLAMFMPLYRVSLVGLPCSSGTFV